MRIQATKTHMKMKLMIPTKKVPYTPKRSFLMPSTARPTARGRPPVVRASRVVAAVPVLLVRVHLGVGEEAGVEERGAFIAQQTLLDGYA